MKKRACLFLFVCVVSDFAICAVPNSMRFVSDERNQGGILQVVTWDRGTTGFKVLLNKESNPPVEELLLKDATCKEVSDGGYHCYIQPYRAPGIIITDVNFIPTAKGVFDISTIVIIGGSFTATHLIGHDFVVEQARKKVSR